LVAILVVDASVALKWLLPEPDSEAALDLIGRAVLAAPEMMVVEVANALSTRIRRRELTPLEARTSLADLHAIHVDYAADRELASAALSLAADLGHPVYDCLYLALAIDRAAMVVTADRRFVSAVDAHPYLAGRVKLLHDLPGVS
jgi:predicted nucleic acid-binding protein